MVITRQAITWFDDGCEATRSTGEEAVIGGYLLARRQQQGTRREHCLAKAGTQDYATRVDAIVLDSHGGLPEVWIVLAPLYSDAAYAAIFPIGRDRDNAKIRRDVRAGIRASEKLRTEIKDFALSPSGPILRLSRKEKSGRYIERRVARLRFVQSCNELPAIRSEGCTGSRERIDADDHDAV